MARQRLHGFSGGQCTAKLWLSGGTAGTGSTVRRADMCRSRVTEQWPREAMAHSVSASQDPVAEKASLRAGYGTRSHFASTC